MPFHPTKYILKPFVLCAALSFSHIAAAEDAASGNYKIDAGHSTVLFTVGHLGTSELTGRFNEIEGSFVLDKNKAPKVDVTIKTASVDTNHEKRNAHLRSPDFFNVKQYPVMHFTADKISYDPQGRPTRMHGKLTLHGKTKPVTFEISPVGAGKYPWGGYRAGFNARTTLKRSEFGMNFMPGGIGEEVSVALNIEAIKE